MIPYRAKAPSRNRTLPMPPLENPKHPRPLDLSAFNDRGELKTPAFLVLSLVFLGRYPISLALGALSTLVLGRRGLELGGLGFPPLDGLAASIPSLLLLVLGRILVMDGMEYLNRVVIEGVLLSYCAVYLVRSERAAIFFRVSGVVERN